MKETFIEKRFTDASLRMLKLIDGILIEYQGLGFKLSLRQLYYQLVARDYIPNTVRSYKNIGSLVSDARQAGYIDWDMIEDRGRETVYQSHWRSPADILKIAAQQFTIDKWEDQEYHIEIMVEKDALSGVLVPVCEELDIRITANKGYSSSSTMYAIGKRLMRAKRFADKKICILYLGDHDPSGIDMTRDVTERLVTYGRLDGAAEDGEFEVVRIALNYDQVMKWRPPENPAKETDSRFDAYRKNFGDKSWELDAIDPVKLAQLVRSAVLERRDEYLWDAAEEREEEMRNTLLKYADDYSLGG